MIVSSIENLFHICVGKTVGGKPPKSLNWLIIGYEYVNFGNFDIGYMKNDSIFAIAKNTGCETQSFYSRLL